MKMLQDTWYAKPFKSSSVTDISALFSVHTIPTLVVVSFLLQNLAMVPLRSATPRSDGLDCGAKAVSLLARKNSECVAPFVTNYPPPYQLSRCVSQVDVVNGEIVTYNGHHELERDPEGLSSAAERRTFLCSPLHVTVYFLLSMVCLAGVEFPWYPKPRSQLDNLISSCAIM